MANKPTTQAQEPEPTATLAALRRADSIVKNMLLHSRSGASEHRAVDLNAAAEEALNLPYHGARAETPGFNITLKKDLDPGVGMVEVYPQEISRMLVNLVNNGFYAAHKRAEATPRLRTHLASVHEEPWRSDRNPRP